MRLSILSAMKRLLALDVSRRALTNGTIACISSMIRKIDFGPSTSCSDSRLPIVKFLSRSSSMLGLSASYPYGEESVSRSAQRDGYAVMNSSMEVDTSVGIAGFQF